jgi:hypothetical protein
VCCTGPGGPLIVDPETLSFPDFERGFCLLKGIAEGTYNSKHAEAARLYYTTTTTTMTITYTHTHTY